MVIMTFDVNLVVERFNLKEGSDARSLWSGRVECGSVRATHMIGALFN